jgi:putative redox protein
MAMTASAVSIGGGTRHAIDVNGRHTMYTDEPERLGGTDTGPAPHELLPAILAACASTMVVMYARNRGWELGEVRVDVSYDPEQTPRPVALTLHLPDGLTPDQVTRLRAVADACPVKRALESGFTFAEEVRLGDAPVAHAA